MVMVEAGEHAVTGATCTWTMARMIGRKEKGERSKSEGLMIIAVSGVAMPSSTCCMRYAIVSQQLAVSRGSIECHWRTHNEL